MTTPAQGGLLPVRGPITSQGGPPEGRLHLVRPLAGEGAPRLARLLPVNLAGVGIEARVTGHDDAGRPILQTPRGAFLLEDGPHLANGGTLRLVPADVKASAAAERPSAERPSEAQGGATRAEPPPLHSLPHLPGDRALAGVLARLLAPQAGTGQTHGDEPGPEDAHAAPESPVARTVADGWRLLPLVLTGATEELVRVFRRDGKHPEGDPEAAQGPVSRLVFDVEWSRLGRTQIDLLVQGQKVDLKMRSRHPLDAELTGEIGQAFLAALEAGGLRGTLSFISPDLTPLPESGALVDPIQA